MPRGQISEHLRNAKRRPSPGKRSFDGSVSRLGHLRHLLVTAAAACCLIYWQGDLHCPDEAFKSSLFPGVLTAEVLLWCFLESFCRRLVSATLRALHLNNLAMKRPKTGTSDRLRRRQRRGFRLIVVLLFATKGVAPAETVKPVPEDNGDNDGGGGDEVHRRLMLRKRQWQRQNAQAAAAAIAPFNAAAGDVERQPSVATPERREPQAAGDGHEWREPQSGNSGAAERHQYLASNRGLEAINRAAAWLRSLNHCPSSAQDPQSGDNQHRRERKTSRTSGSGEPGQLRIGQTSHTSQEPRGQAINASSPVMRGEPSMREREPQTSHSSDRQRGKPLMRHQEPQINRSSDRQRGEPLMWQQESQTNRSNNRQRGEPHAEVNGAAAAANSNPATGLGLGPTQERPGTDPFLSPNVTAQSEEAVAEVSDRQLLRGGNLGQLRIAMLAYLS